MACSFAITTDWTVNTHRMGKHYFNTDLLFDQFLFGSFTVYKNLHIFL